MVNDLLKALRHTPALADHLVERLPAAGLFGMYRYRRDDPEAFRYGREPDGRPSPPWGWGDL